MPIELLGILVVLGVSLIVAAVKFSGLSHPFVIRDVRAARQAYLSHYPGSTLKACILTGDQKAAFFRTATPRTGLVAAFGAHYICRELEPQDVKSISQNGSDLRVHFADFTYPAATYRFKNLKDAEKVVSWLWESPNA